jgi:hypothetical protein
MKGKGNVDIVEYPEGFVAELEDIVLNEEVVGKWTPEEVAILKRYYGRIRPTSRLLKYLPKRTLTSIHDKARRSGISFEDAV